MVNHFVTEQRLTGQVSFDFIQALTELLRDRATPALTCYHVLQPSRVADAYLGREPLAEPCNLF